jgi:hypothetical protein
MSEDNFLYFSFYVGRGLISRNSIEPTPRLICFGPYAIRPSLAEI